MQSILALGGLLQLMASRPWRMRLAGRFVYFHAGIPDLSRFPLGGFQSAKLTLREMCQSIHTYGLHALVVAWMRQNGKWGKPALPALRLPITWSGERRTAAVCSRARHKKKPRGYEPRVVSSTG